ncbi:MAG: parallel beta-helix repeat [Chitinophagaceae bacterium]|nr:parallel beta-helix repeat [Chitinophagaceae bacterium]
MNRMTKYLLVLFACSTLSAFSQEKRGADMPWTTYEAEHMKTTGTVLGPKYTAFQVETESSGQKCVKLTKAGQNVSFKSLKKANAIVVRFSLPDSPEGGGTTATLGLYVNGKLVQPLTISSKLSLLYGGYPFSNDPKLGKARNFYDEVRLKDLKINAGDLIKIQRDDVKGNTAEYCIIDLVDLEEVAAPLTAPENSLSIMDFKGANFDGDYTEPLKLCVGKAWESKKSVWIPAGTYKISGEIMVPANMIIQGAGMWHTILVGNETDYADDPSRRLKFFGNGGNVVLSDFAIIGHLEHRADDEPNDGIVGSYGVNSKIQRIWIEHTKIGVWVENSKNLLVEGCRFRNTIADGVNFCVGMAESTMKNCTTRGTGDDCFAMWPATFLLNKFKPGNNVITHCTGQLPFLANGAAIYGGESNKISNCLFTDISPGSAILISTTFPTEDPKTNNHFSGTTVIENCDIKTSGGWDHSWDFRASISICMDRRGIPGIQVQNTNIENSFSDGISIVTRGADSKGPELTNAVFKNVTITKSGIGATDKHALWIDNTARGSVTIEQSKITDVKNESKNFTVTNK